MARSVKKAPKAKKTTKPAEGGLSGVSYDENGPVYEEPLSQDQREIRAEALANRIGERAELVAAFKDVAKKHKKDLGDIDDDIEQLAESLRTGKVKTSAQKSLPGVADLPAEGNA